MLHLTNENNKNEEMIEVVNDVLSTANSYVENGIPLIKKLADSFYQQPDRDAWQQLTDLFEGMGWIIETLTQIDSINNLKDILNDYKTWNEYVQAVSELNEIVPELETALESSDNIFIGDLLLYEVTPIFEQMLTKLQILKPRTVDQGAN